MAWLDESRPVLRIPSTSRHRPWAASSTGHGTCDGRPLQPEVWLVEANCVRQRSCASSAHMTGSGANQYIERTIAIVEDPSVYEL